MPARSSSRKRPGRASSVAPYGTRLRRSFFDRPTEIVAREILGAILSVASGRQVAKVRLVETEAYVADDPANHANRGMTRRNRSMFGPPGTMYVYQVHQSVCANLVTRPGQAVLLRAGEPVTETVAGSSTGPGRLCRSLGITLLDDGADAVQGARFSIRRAPLREGEAVGVGRRIGISQARERPLRFAVIGSKWVSSPRIRGIVLLTSASPRRTLASGPTRRSRRRRTRASAGGRSGARSVGR